MLNLCKIDWVALIFVKTTQFSRLFFDSERYPLGKITEMAVPCPTVLFTSILAL